MASQRGNDVRDKTGAIRFKNPFGDVYDGIADADFTSKIARDVVQVASITGLRESMKKLKALKGLTT